MANQVKYNLDTREIEEDFIPYCKSQKITVVAYSPLKGLAIRKKDELLEEIASKIRENKSPGCIELSYFRGKCCCHSKSE